MCSLPPGVYSVEYTAPDTLSSDISDTLEEYGFAPFPGHPETPHEDAFNPTSTNSPPFPETPAFDHFRSGLPQIISTISTVVHDVGRQVEQNVNKVTEIVSPTSPTSPAPAPALSPLSDCEPLPPSCYSTTTPSSQSSVCDSTPSTSNEETLQLPVEAAEKKVRGGETGGTRKGNRSTRSKENHFCCYCNESFTRDLDAERHQRTCRLNPTFSRKEQCKVCMKALPVRLDARRRHWGTLECSEAARERGYPRMDEEYYRLL